MCRDVELVCSRIFHDLASPLGAISAGLELIGLSGQLSAEQDLIAESTEMALARLQFFRTAFGKAGNGAAKSDGLFQMLNKCFPHLEIRGLPVNITDEEAKFLCLIMGLCTDLSYGTAHIEMHLDDDGLVFDLPFEIPRPSENKTSAYLARLEDEYSDVIAAAEVTPDHTRLRVRSNLP